MKNKRRVAAAVCMIAALYAVLHISGIGCPIKFLTGMPCAGCGMTRAWLSASVLDFKAAFKYHPMFLLPPAYAVLHMFRKRININVIQLVFIVSLLALYAVRIISPHDSVIAFEPEKGAVFIALRKVGEILKWL